MKSVTILRRVQKNPMQTNLLTNIGNYKADESVEIDYGEFAQNLILSDSVTINSVQLKDIIALSRDLGVSDVISILKSGAVKICVRCASIGMPEKGDKATYKLIALHTQDQQEYMDKCFERLRASVAEKKTDIDALISAINENLIPESVDPFRQALAETRKDILSGPQYLQQILRRKGQSQHKILLEVEDIISAIEEVEPEVYKIECDALRKVGISEDVCRKLVQNALFAACNSNQWITESNHFNALTTFHQYNEMYETNKFELVADRYQLDLKSHQFHRVIEASGLHDVSEALKSGKINFSALIEARGTDEALQFRKWLRDIENVEDSKLEEQLASTRTSIGNRLGTNTSRVLRFSATLGLGLIPGYGTAIGAVASAVDSFILDRVFNRAGPIYFVKSSLPSIVSD